MVRLRYKVNQMNGVSLNHTVVLGGFALFEFGCIVCYATYKDINRNAVNLDKAIFFRIEVKIFVSNDEGKKRTVPLITLHGVRLCALV